jgi:CheY-like chemotaxis protein
MNTPLPRSPAARDLPGEAAPPPWRLALIGFTPFERSALQSCLRLSAPQLPLALETGSLDACDLVLADGDLAPVIEALRRRQALERTVAIGTAPVDGALAHVPRPINPHRLLRRLGELLAGRRRVPRPEGTAPAAAESRHLRHALVVSPDTALLRLMTFHLSRFGFEVHLARNAAEGLAAEARFGGDDVFVARALPDGDGFTLARQLRDVAFASGHRTPRVVLMSEDTGAPERMRALAAGCDSVMHPSLRVDTLLGVIGEHRVTNTTMADTALAPFVH